MMMIVVFNVDDDDNYHDDRGGGDDNGSDMTKLLHIYDTVVIMMIPKWIFFHINTG